MKNMGTIIGIVLTLVMIIIVGVLTYHSMYGSSKAAVEKTYQVPSLRNTGSKPDKTLPSSGTADSSNSALPLTGDATADTLLNELNTTVDDEGAKDLQTLKEEASQL